MSNKISLGTTAAPEDLIAIHAAKRELFRTATNIIVGIVPDIYKVLDQEETALLREASKILQSIKFKQSEHVENARQKIQDAFSASEQTHNSLESRVSETKLK